MKIGEKALVLFSGGQDSTTCLYWAKERFDEVFALNILYGQRHWIERESAKHICHYAGIDLIEHEFDLFRKINNSALTDPSKKIADEHWQNNDLPASFVPGRNIILLSTAAILAFSMEIKNIVTGVCETDYSGYPDCRFETISSLEKTLRLGMEYEFFIHTPLMFLTKAESIKLAQKLEGCMEALKYSHTCYEGMTPPCGECPSCKIRAKGFEEAGVPDPLVERFKI